ncbi:MAG: hypothetical protein COW54_01425 [Rhodobacteraceae bacterium CG17_big_fil_post_rev_8_21_14_2_50_63_15]|nr:hypothetical protein [Roseovarius sp.]PIV79995.1 MAG: hypothetical protein COW54_01425 [Rhodobacteraceae bacterium CG17_big_fil_post_rev_8_21_14_2_50_63_15]
MKRTIALGALLAMTLGGMAQADVSRTIGRATKIKSGTSAVMPPADHQGQWWTHPLGCEYSRTGRPGETVWYLIINTARPGCATYIVVHGFKDVY